MTSTRKKPALVKNRGPLPTNSPGQAEDRTQEPPRRRGRPPGSTMPADQRKSDMIRVLATHEQKAAFAELLGPAWLREQIDRAIRQRARAQRNS